MRKSSVIIGIFLCTLLSPFIACAQDEPTIKVAIASFDSDHVDHSEAEQQLDQYVYEQLGFHVDMEYLEYKTYGEEMNTYLLQNQYPDVYLVVGHSDYKMLQQKGYLKPLNDLLHEYGQELTSICSDQELLSHTEEDGFCYAIPCIHTRSLTVGFEYRVRIAEQYGLDMSKVASLEDLDEIFASLKKQNPDITPLGWTNYCSWDMLSDSLGVLMNMGQSDRIENLYETEEYRNICLTMSQWRKKGYLLNTDYIQQDFSSYVKLSDVFGKLADYNPAMSWTDGLEGGEEFCCIPLSETATMSNAYQRNCWVISSETRYPRYAMEFLNLLYTDKVLPNLLAYGVSQKDYSFTNDDCNEIELFSATTSSSERPIKIRNYLVGNQYLCYRLKGFPHDIWEQCVSYDKNALLSKGFGFEFDPAPVAEQVLACKEIVSFYEPLLLYGASDAEEVLSLFIQELKDAGIDEVIKEKQKQFDKWKAEGTS